MSNFFLFFPTNYSISVACHEVISLWHGMVSKTPQTAGKGLENLSADGNTKWFKITWFFAVFTLDLINHSGPTATSTSQ